MTYSRTWHDALTLAPWLVFHTCDMTRSHTWRDSFTHMTWCIHMLVLRREFVRRCASSHQFKVPCTCDMTHSYVWHDASVCVTWRIHVCEVTHSYMSRDAFTCWCCGESVWVAYSSYQFNMPFVCEKTHWYMSRDAFTCWCCGESVWFAITRAINSICRVCVMWLIHTCDIMHSYVGVAEGVCYGVATISRLLKILRLFCKRAL